MTHFKVECSILNEPVQFHLPLSVVRSNKFEETLKSTAADLLVKAYYDQGRKRFTSEKAQLIRVMTDTPNNCEEVMRFLVHNECLISGASEIQRKRDEENIRQREEQEKIFFECQAIRRNKVPAAFHEFLSRVARQIEQDDDIVNLDAIEEEVYSEFEKAWKSFVILPTKEGTKKKRKSN